MSDSSYIGGNNYLWIKLEKYSLYIGLVYNPGNTNFKDFLEVYDSQLQRKKRAIVFGDFNIDLLTRDGQSKQYKELLKENGHTLLNKIATKYSTRECTTKKVYIRSHYN